MIIKSFLNSYYFLIQFIKNFENNFYNENKELIWFLFEFYDIKK